MSLYEYPLYGLCETDQRVAGTDDHVAICVNCRGVMLRVYMDIWAPLWEEQRQLQEDGPRRNGTSIGTMTIPARGTPPW